MAVCGSGVIAKERVIASGRVPLAGRVRDERESSVGRVEVAFGVVVESKRFQFQKRRRPFHPLAQVRCRRNASDSSLLLRCCPPHRSVSILSP